MVSLKHALAMLHKMCGGLFFTLATINMIPRNIVKRVRQPNVPGKAKAVQKARNPPASILHQVYLLLLRQLTARVLHIQARC